MKGKKWEKKRQKIKEKRQFIIDNQWQKVV